jgi:hypothetical protein
MAAALAVAGLIVAVPAEASAKKAPAKPFDFNGDRRVDKALGWPARNVKGVHATGYVDVTYAKSRKRQRLTLNSPGIPGKPGKNARFGSLVKSADFDQDGYADLLVGSTRGTVIVFGTAKGLGSRTVVLGGSRSLLPPPAYNQDAIVIGDFDGNRLPDVLFTQSGIQQFVNPGARKLRPGTVIKPSSTSAATLYKAAVGDFTGDGYDDVVTGNGRPALYKGSAESGLSLTGEPVSGTGWSALGPRVGDINGDGLDDLVGPRQKPTPGGGFVMDGFLLSYGTPTGLAAPVAFNQDSPGIPGTTKDDNKFGIALAVADVNRDGFADVAAGAPGQQVGKVKDAGSVTILYGSATGLSGKGAKVITENTPGIPGAPRARDNFGTVLWFADCTGDGRPDLTVYEDVSVTYLLRNVKGVISTSKVKKYERFQTIPRYCQ